MLNLKRIRILWLWMTLIVAALFMISSKHGRQQTWNPAEQVIVEITAPIQKLLVSSIRGVENFWLTYFDIMHIRQENTQLKQELESLRMENGRHREMAATYERLKELLDFKTKDKGPYLAAHVIGLDPTGWFASVILDKGKQDGLQVNMPVLEATGLIGRLISVSPNYSKVLLLIDQNSAVDCLIQRSREKGILKGISLNQCRFHYLVKTGDVVVGDRVITSGMDGIFPKGVPVGEVIEVKDIPRELFKDVKVKPSVDFSKLEEVLILLKEDRLLHLSKEAE